MLKLSGQRTERVKNKIIAGIDEVFKDTPFYGEQFEFTISYTANTRLKASVYAKKEAEQTEGKESLNNMRHMYTKDPEYDKEGNVIVGGITLYDEIINTLIQNKYILAAAITAWEGIGDENGNPMECNDENVIRLLEDPDMMPLFTPILTTLVELAQPTETEKEAIEAVGESLDGSDGSTDLQEEIQD